MGDIDELHCLTHLLDQPGVASDVGIVQWRIDFIEHAERCRVQFENGKYQGQGGQRFLPAREQVDGAVLLARWPRHDRYPCIE
ncbi:hypothetical protein D3C75_1148960 [compost metagenome]